MGGALGSREYQRASTYRSSGLLWQSRARIRIEWLLYTDGKIARGYLRTGVCGPGVGAARITLTTMSLSSSYSESNLEVIAPSEVTTCKASTALLSCRSGG